MVECWNTETQYDNHTLSRETGRHHPEGQAHPRAERRNDVVIPADSTPEDMVREIIRAADMADKEIRN